MNEQHLIEDVKSILDQHKAEYGYDAPFGMVIDGLRRALFANYKPESGRRWTLRGGPVDQINMLEEAGFVLVKEGRTTRVTFPAAIEVA